MPRQMQPSGSSQCPNPAPQPPTQHPPSPCTHLGQALDLGRVVRVARGHAEGEEEGAAPGRAGEQEGRGAASAPCTLRQVVPAAAAEQPCSPAWPPRAAAAPTTAPQRSPPSTSAVHSHSLVQALVWPQRDLKVHDLVLALSIEGSSMVEGWGSRLCSARSAPTRGEAAMRRAAPAASAHVWKLDRHALGQVQLRDVLLQSQLPRRLQQARWVMVWLHVLSGRRSGGGRAAAAACAAVPPMPCQHPRRASHLPLRLAVGCRCGILLLLLLHAKGSTAVAAVSGAGGGGGGATTGSAPGGCGLVAWRLAVQQHGRA